MLLHLFKVCRSIVNDLRNFIYDFFTSIEIEI